MPTEIMVYRTLHGSEVVTTFSRSRGRFQRADLNAINAKVTGSRLPLDKSIMLPGPAILRVSGDITLRRAATIYPDSERTALEVLRERHPEWRAITGDRKTKSYFGELVDLLAPGRRSR